MRNRLGGESSPYLLQHAENPVDWYPWGEEAFARARAEDRPIFLSIGYSTCHWCHVMAHESFEDEGVARLLNEHFVSVKVDREERPDVDAVYMAAVQSMTGQGGWPLSVFLTPERRPFYGGTYFPPTDGFGRPGFPSVLAGIADAWANRRDEIESSAGQVTGHLANLSAAIPESEVGETTIAKAFAEFAERFDAVEGGFGGAPKFPRSHSLMLLLRHHERTGEARALEIVTTTLDHMARGGIYDHLGGGLHRYSTDRRWLVPHFEKMLYDQALAVRTYVETYQATGDERHADVARDVLRYVLRDLRDEGGAFYSAEDADSEGVEGKFYVWDHAEILDVLGEEDGRFLAGVFGAEEGGNFDDEATRRPSGKNILHLDGPLDAGARARLEPLMAKLLAAREERVRPLLDDKILTDGNGLMIGALATAGRALAEPEYVAAASAAADFLLEHLVADGRLLHRWRKGKASIPGFLDDSAFLAEGLFELYQATLDPRWLAESKRLLGEAVRLFTAGEAGGFHLVAADGEELVARPREIYDGAQPSGNSVMARTLLRVGRLAMDREIEAEGERTIRAFSGALAAAPTGYPYLLLALDFAIGPTSEIVIAGAPDDPGTAALRAEVDGRFLPRAVVAGRPAGADAEAVASLVPFLRELDPVGGKPAAYVCRDYACRRPVTDPAALASLLEEV